MRKLTQLSVEGGWMYCVAEAGLSYKTAVHRDKNQIRSQRGRYWCDAAACCFPCTLPCNFVTPLPAEVNLIWRYCQGAVDTDDWLRSGVGANYVKYN